MYLLILEIRQEMESSSNAHTREELTELIPEDHFINIVVPTSSSIRNEDVTSNTVEYDDEGNDGATYLKLLQENRNFRFYLLGYMITEAGT